MALIENKFGNYGSRFAARRVTRFQDWMIVTILQSCSGQLESELEIFDLATFVGLLRRVHLQR